MNAAIYARKSTAQDGAVSTTRQVELSRDFAAARGWEVVEVYIDEARSGAIFGQDDDGQELRPEFARMLVAAGSRARPFDVLICMDGSRLGRDQFRTGYVLQQLHDADVAVWFYQEARQAKLDDATGKFMENVRGFAAEMETEKARARGRESARAMARGGHVTGGAGVYGYTYVRENGRVRRTPNPAQVEVILRIFREISEGRGYAKVAQGLNRDGVVAPRGPGRHWSVSGVREIVMRELYLGRVVWGKTQWEWRRGRKRKVQVPESQWVITEEPGLRVVPQDLWDASHKRLGATRAVYLRQTGGQLHGRPESGLEARWLLSGFLQCSVCGGAIHAITKTSRRGGPRTYYVCNNQRTNGSCTNSLSASLPDVDAAVLEIIRRDVLTPEVLEDVINRAVELHRNAPDENRGRREKLQEEVERLRGELARYAEAIATAGPLPSILGAMQEREGRLADFQTRLAHLDELDILTRNARDGDALTLEARARLSHWADLAGNQPAVARQILRKILVGKITMTPKGGQYQISGRASYGAVIGAVAGLVPPG